ncbi:MAG: glycosyltransferase, partial [Candidatus Omnitrophica bacterium]|nr:glycosyltransferase [Candidatus Omnitrophota bacterium]
RRLFVFLEKLAARFTHKLIVVSLYDKEKGLRNHIGKEEQYLLIRYGIDYKEFTSVRPYNKAEFGIKNQELLVGTISCFKPQKAPLDFIHLAHLVKQSLPNTKFILIGDGILRSKIERLIKRLHLKDEVILTGWRRDISRLLSMIDVFVLTSLWEGLPVSILEAMASSKPVIVTNTGGVAEIIREGRTGLLVSPRDIQGMAKRLITLLQNRDLMQRMGREAKESLGNEFTVESMTNRTIDLYQIIRGAHVN